MTTLDPRSETDPIRAAKQELSQRYVRPSPITRALALKTALTPNPQRNVVGVGIGEKITDGKPTGQRAIKILVRMKFREGDIASQNLLPKQFQGFPVDVEEVGLIRALQGPPHPRSRLRPARPGCSIGFEDPGHTFTMAGTFGALVCDGAVRYILSNNHVLADENKLAPGASIFQPGLLDGGKAATDEIATLTKFIPLQTAGSNSVDCAIARLDAPNVANRLILRIGSPSGVSAAAVDMVVHKFGRTTSYTAGRVTSVDTDINVTYDLGTLTFAGQIVITGLNGTQFSNAGDSGSLILERSTGKAIGLLFAGGSTVTFANHIEDVLQSLGVTLVTTSSAPQPGSAVARGMRGARVGRGRSAQPATGSKPATISHG